MRKIIPVILMILSVAATIVSGVALYLICLMLATPYIALFFLPIVLIGFSSSVITTGFTFLFRKDKLCRIALYIALPGFLMAMVTLGIWVFGF